MSNKLLCRSPQQVKAFRDSVYPLNIAVLYNNAPTRLKKVRTFGEFLDIFDTLTYRGQLEAFSVASIPYYGEISPLSFVVDHITHPTKEFPIRKCTLSCDELQWKGENLQISKVPDLVEKRLWIHIKNTHPNLFNTFP